MDLNYHRQREQAERLAAEQARTPEARAAHTELADAYRKLIEASERVEALTPRPRSVA